VESPERISGNPFRYREQPLVGRGKVARKLDIGASGRTIVAGATLPQTFPSLVWRRLDQKTSGALRRFSSEKPSHAPTVSAIKSYNLKETKILTPILAKKGIRPARRVFH